MPKSIINKKEYKKQGIGSFVYKWLKQANKRVSDLADELFISQPGLTYKMRHNSFSYADMLTIFEYLNVPDEEILYVMKV